MNISREKWPRKFEQAYKWIICYLLMALSGLYYGAENEKKNATYTFTVVQV